ncbi:MAG TPA: hypothetical protein VK338_02650, partial [Candidatus Nitrosocosmicus sp.]|nr:hypothetical protein [Candidatus Nitrosocosmicus sp.]
MRYYIHSEQDNTIGITQDFAKWTVLNPNVVNDVTRSVPVEINHALFSSYKLDGAHRVPTQPGENECNALLRAYRATTIVLKGAADPEWPVSIYSDGQGGQVSFDIMDLGRGNGIGHSAAIDDDFDDGYATIEYGKDSFLIDQDNLHILRLAYKHEEELRKEGRSDLTLLSIENFILEHSLGLPEGNAGTPEHASISSQRRK